MNIHYSDVQQQWSSDVQAYIDELCAYQRKKQPEVPLFFIHFLHQLLRSCLIPLNRAQVYGVATTLLKMGLDTHIQNQHQPMHVLAGDYLSIQFYCLLAEQGEIEGICHIAKAISKINEWNMEHHVWLQQGVSYDEIALQRVQHIVSALIIAVADFFYESCPEIESWLMLIPRVFLINEVCSSGYPLTPGGDKFIKNTMLELYEILPSFQSGVQVKLKNLLKQHHIYAEEVGKNHEITLCSR